MILVAGLIAWLYFDQIVRMVRIWHSDLDWSHGFFILPFALYLIHTRRIELARVPVRPAWGGLALVLFGILAYVYAIWARFGSPQPLTMVFVIAGSVAMLGGWRILGALLFPIGFLVLAMPPPDYAYKQITQPMQQFAAMVAQVALGLLPNIELIRNGFSLTAYDATSGALRATFEVAGACSGMRSLMAFVALGLAVAYFSPRPTWHRILMTLIVLPVALFCNVLRVVITGMFLIYDWGKLAAGTPHMLLGLVTFGLGMALYSLAMYVLDHLFVDDNGPSTTAARVAI